MALDIVIPPERLKTVGDLLDQLNGTLKVAFLPGVLDQVKAGTKIENPSFVANQEKNYYELTGTLLLSLPYVDEVIDLPSLPLDLHVIILPDLDNLKRTATYTGTLHIPVDAAGVSKLSFEVPFSEAMGDLLIGTCHFKHGQPLDIGQLFRLVAPPLADAIPEGLSLPLEQELLLVMRRPEKGDGLRLLLGVALSAGIPLDGLPLAGEFLKGTELSFGIELVVITDAFKPEEVRLIDQTLRLMGLRFALRESSASAQELEPGANLVAVAMFADLHMAWYVPLKPPGWSGVLPQIQRKSSSDFPITLALNFAWLAIERSFGPIHFGKLGFGFLFDKKSGSGGGGRNWLRFIPDITIDLSGLKLNLDGIGIEFELPDLTAPQLVIEGFDIELSNPFLNITGKFLKSQQGNYKDYAGMASLQLKGGGPFPIGLGAIGAYAHSPDGNNSLFLYACLEKPFGGPPFFFVTGIAGGFGINRRLKPPELGDLSSFPLVRMVMENNAGWETGDIKETIGGLLRSLGHNIVIAPDTGFLALGVKFTSFKLLDGFGLVYLQLGDGFEVGVIGVARLQLPPKASVSLAFVEIELLARFSPSEGFLIVRGQLSSNSYVLHESCKLTGGFAFCAWFAGSHAGDFVISIGGYHPKFDKPAHYPPVPRLGFEWRIDKSISLHGGAYFTLCSHAVMVGGHFEASFRAGSAWASFKMGADFLICWKPFSYDISIYVHFSFGLGALSASLGAELGIWGPSIGGYAKLKVFLFSIKVKFGNQSSRYPEPLSWGDFRGSFLPDDKEVCSVAIAEGLMRELRPKSGGDLWVVNPEELVLTTDSIIPTKKLTCRETVEGNSQFGIATVGIRSNDLAVEQRVVVKHVENGVGTDANDRFVFAAIRRDSPTAAWGEPQLVTAGGKERLRLPSVNGTRFVKGTIAGARIEPKPAPPGGDTDDLPVELLQFETEAVKDSYHYFAPSPFAAKPGDDEARRGEIGRTVANHAARSQLLRLFGFDPDADVALSAGVADTFTFAPLIRAA